MAQFFYDVLELIGFAHPLHPVLITMVVGPVIAAFLFNAVALVFKKPEFHKTSRQLTVVAFIFWFPTVAVGLIDWVHFYGGAAMPEISAKFALAAALFVVLLVNILLFKKGQDQPLIPLVLMLVATVNVSALGYFGGDIVFGSGKKVASASASAAPGAAAVNVDGFKTVSQDGYDLAWKVEGPNLSVRVSYATNGWVGFGIGNTGTMEGSHIIIGFVADGQAIIEDHFGYGGSQHGPQAKVGGKDSLIAREGTFVDGKTTLTFTMPLNTGNPKDPVLVPGQTYKVLLANGGEDALDLESYHGRSGRIVLDLTL